MAEDMKNNIEDLSTKPPTPSEEPTKESENAQGEVVEKDEAKKAEDEKLIHVVGRAKVPTPPGKRPGPSIG
ncbi:hypothetical protein P3L10_014915 [Capsicum annuum]